MSASAGSVIRLSLIQGTRTGILTGLQLLTIMVPISLGVALLEWLGVLNLVARQLAPLFSLLGLPGTAAFPLVTGALINVYSAIAIMVTLPFSVKQLTILSLMVLLAHNLPVEVTVQKKAKSPALAIIAVRLLSAILAGFLLNAIMADNGHVIHSAVPLIQPDHLSLSGVISLWAQNSLRLIGKVMLIVIGLMIGHELLERTGVIKAIARLVYPVVFLMGLSKRSAFLWLVSNMLGLAYGAGIILKETREGKIGDDDIKTLNLSMAVCHSIIEDTLLFYAIGALLFWIVIPRIVLAALLVWSYRLFRGLK